MTRSDLSDDSERHSEEIDTGSRTVTSLTRRRALGVLGAGLVTGGVGTVSADDHDAIVYESGSDFVAENGGSTVYAGGDFIAAIQAAVDSLTTGRTTKETVRVDASGYTGSASSAKAVDLPSYTVLDVPGSIDVDDSGEPWIIPVRARSVESIEIPRLNVTGNPRYGIFVRSCSDVTIGNVNMDLSSGLGIRIDDRDGGRTQNVSLNYAYVSGSSTHAVETYGVDDIDIGTVETYDTGGCGLLLNDTAYATVDHVDATRADEGGGYAGFRCANDAGPDITVDRVDAVDCGRGIFTVSGSHGISISNVSVEGCGAGALIQDTRNTTISGGSITDNAGEGIRIDSRSSDDHHHTRDVTIEYLQIEGNDYGVYETGPDTEHNAITDNDFCDNGTDIETYASSTTVSGNSSCGDGGSGGGSISTGTYRVTNANSGQYLEVDAAGTSDGDNIQQWSDTGHACQEWYVEDVGGGEYRFENAHSGKVMDVDGASSDDGADIIQWEDGGGANQRWYVWEDAAGEYAIESVNSGKLAEVEAASSDEGANVQQWEDNGGSHQRWTFTQV
ncbi:RICIN domain-containing protein [Halobacteria archaeon AArc-m2/3/4]|uniref:RICIN domain-containing protein n=1 Tax=Natronoglomus mannanivorans TaxID=2979990 RepID=A0ABT2QF47_9EURY|nr:RICIN domain-containing protein [Halobacteria archaeon AArc-m2/3/4]